MNISNEMKQATKIHEWAVNQEYYGESARAILTADWSFDHEVEVFSQELIGQVLDKSLTVSDLRAGVIWANALDAEAVEAYGPDATTGEAAHERMARRLIHHAGRTALEAVGTESKRIILSVRRRQKNLVQ